MRQARAGVHESEDGRLATPNLVPGKRVYDEDLFYLGPVEHRSWNPQRSKLAAYLLKGGQAWPYDERSRVLYLGAANGTTPSHVSDVARHGLVYAVEFSPRSFRDLLVVSESRPNLVPILADAWRPETYAPLVGDVDVLYMDIAQRNQAEIFARNLLHFRPRAGMLMLKSRSVDVAREPREVFADSAAAVERLAPYHVTEVVELDPFEKDHAAIVVEQGASTRPREPEREARPRERDARGPRDARPPRRDAPHERGPRREHGGPRGERDRHDRDRGRGGPERRGPPRKG